MLLTLNEPGSFLLSNNNVQSYLLVEVTSPAFYFSVHSVARLKFFPNLRAKVAFRRRISEPKARDKVIYEPVALLSYRKFYLPPFPHLFSYFIKKSEEKENSQIHHAIQEKDHHKFLSCQAP